MLSTTPKIAADDPVTCMATRQNTVADHAGEQVHPHRGAQLRMEPAEEAAEERAVGGGHRLHPVADDHPRRTLRHQDQREDDAGHREHGRGGGAVHAEDLGDRFHQPADAGDVVGGQHHQDREDRQQVGGRGDTRGAGDRDRDVARGVLHLAGRAVAGFEAQVGEQQQRCRAEQARQRSG